MEKKRVKQEVASLVKKLVIKFSAFHCVSGLFSTFATMPELVWSLSLRPPTRQI